MPFREEGPRDTEVSTPSTLSCNGSFGEVVTITNPTLPQESGPSNTVTVLTVCKSFSLYQSHQQLIAWKLQVQGWLWFLPVQHCPPPTLQMACGYWPRLHGEHDQDHVDKPTSTSSCHHNGFDWKCLRVPVVWECVPRLHTFYILCEAVTHHCCRGPYVMTLM